MKRLSVEDSLRNRILFIGKEIPAGVAQDRRNKFVIIGCPADVINETKFNQYPEGLHIDWESEDGYLPGKNRKQISESFLATPLSKANFMELGKDERVTVALYFSIPKDIEMPKDVGDLLALGCGRFEPLGDSKFTQKTITPGEFIK